MKAGLLDRLKQLATSRNLENLTVGPVLTWTTEAIMKHTQELLKIPGGSSHNVAASCISRGCKVYNLVALPTACFRSQ